MNGNNSPRNANSNIGFRCCAKPLFGVCHPGCAWDRCADGHGYGAGTRERLDPTPRRLYAGRRRQAPAAASSPVATVVAEPPPPEAPLKSYGNLWNKITSLEELYQAYRRARRHKNQSPAMNRFAYRLEDNLISLQHELVSGLYRPSGYRSFMIHDPKPRRIYAAAFRDRVVHHSLVAATDPIFDSSMIYDSYACRTGKGSHAALHRLDHFWRSCETRGTAYCLRLDISKYFFSIDHQVLQEMLCRRLREPEVRALVSLILGSLSTGRRPGIGIPIGNLTSQLWANVYLDQLDHFAKEALRIRHYIRYMDDVAIFANDKPTLWGWLSELEAFLNDRLRLSLNPRRTEVLPARQGIPWLGFRILEPGRRRLARRMVIRAACRLKELARQYTAGLISLDQVTQRVMSWIAHASYGDTWRLRESLFGAIQWS